MGNPERAKRRGLYKSFIIGRAFRDGHLGTTAGQVPKRDMHIDRAAMMRLATTPPKPPSVERLLARPIFSTRGAVADLGLDMATENEWSSFLQKAVYGSQHEGLMRQQLMEKLMHEDWDPELRKVMFQRAVSLYRNAQKSQVEIVSVDELRKALPLKDVKAKRDAKTEQKNGQKDDQKPGQKPARNGKPPVPAGKKGPPPMTLKAPKGKPSSSKTEQKPAAKQSKEPAKKEGGGRGGDFYRRVPKEGGKGFRYYYDPEKYNSRKDAHASGDDVKGAAAGKELTKMVHGAGEQGCAVADFGDMVKRYGADHISAGLKKECGEKGSMTYSGGRFYKKRG